MKQIRTALFFLLLLFVPGCIAGAEEMVLEKRYSCDDDTVYAEDLFPDINSSFPIAEFKNRSRIQLSARKLQALFKSHGYEVTVSHPVILLTKAASFDKAPLKAALQKEFLAHYPDLNIRRIAVRARTFFEQGSMRLRSVDIPRPNLTRNKGTFTAVYEGDDNRPKKLFFSYTLDASLTVLKAKRNLANGTILNSKNTTTEKIPFTLMTAPPLGTETLEKVRIKGYAKEGVILTASMVRDIPDVVKNEKVSAVLKEDGVRVIIYATAMEDGKIGELIRLKSDTGQIYNARVVDKNKAEIE